MSSWVIVAIPEESSPVWAMSSEKVPHMTLLYLGEQTDNSNALDVASRIEHIVHSTINRFWLTVDRRGVLGSEQADVLFFEDDFDTLDRLRLLRSYLLRIPELKAAYNSVEQYPNWTPHLTLGYPETPAKPNVEPIYNIMFDKIAFWNEDYDGFEILLKSMPSTLDMSSKFAKEDIFHYVELLHRKGQK